MQCAIDFYYVIAEQVYNIFKQNTLNTIVFKLQLKIVSLKTAIAQLVYMSAFLLCYS